jgi:3-hydroxyacyl-CoA dehydrogenase
MQDSINVSAELHGDGIYAVTFSAPPVNAMRPGLPGATLDQLDHAVRLGARAVLLVPGGTGVLAGADISMQGITWPEGEPRMSDLISALDRHALPTAILLRRSALGGGLEIALACRWRFAVPGTSLGLPEVSLGILPGAGGTQRLPRLLGAQKALDMIVTGAPVPAEQGARLGLLDAVLTSADPVAEARAFMAAALAAEQTPEPVGTRSVEGATAAVFEDARALAGRRRRGETAPLAAIEAVQVAATAPLAEGLAVERRLFETAVAGPQAAAMRHVFFAERKALKDHVPEGTAARPVETVGVVGAGTMGCGIALACLAVGLSVHLIERDDAVLKAGVGRLETHLAERIARGRLDPEHGAAQLARLSHGTALDQLLTADLVIEAVFEDMQVKRDVFSRLVDATRPRTVLATNTSYLDVNRIAEAAGQRARDVVGLHFFSPANVMPLLEVVRGAETSAEVLATGIALVRRLGKTGVVSGVGHGFIANRGFEKYLREAEFLLQEGASPLQVDDALMRFGMPMGPFAVRDLAGLDIGWANRKATAHLRDPALRYSDVGDRICERGWFGRKSGRGFYLYPDGVRKGVEDPEVGEIVAASARTAGIARREIDDVEIIDRCLLAVVNESTRILSGGIARRASDIDLAWINGYGFPRWRGGPMFWSETQGLANALERIRAFDARLDYWDPAPALVDLVESGRSFDALTGKTT